MVTSSINGLIGLQVFYETKLLKVDILYSIAQQFFTEADTGQAVYLYEIFDQSELD